MRDNTIKVIECPLCVVGYGQLGEADMKVPCSKCYQYACTHDVWITGDSAEVNGQSLRVQYNLYRCQDEPSALYWVVRNGSVISECHNKYIARRDYADALEAMIEEGKLVDTVEKLHNDVIATESLLNDAMGEVERYKAMVDTLLSCIASLARDMSTMAAQLQEAQEAHKASTCRQCDDELDGEWELNRGKCSDCNINNMQLQGERDYYNSLVKEGYECVQGAHDGSNPDCAICVDMDYNRNEYIGE